MKEEARKLVESIKELNITLEELGYVSGIDPYTQVRKGSLAVVDEELDIKCGDSIEWFSGAKVHVPIESYFAGDYRLDYDGKYITLYGRDKRYPGFKFSEDQDDWYEEMVLVGCVLEVRGVVPIIGEVTDEYIIINLECYKYENNRH